MTEKITNGSTFLGIELGSTRIKAVLIDDRYTPIAQGSHGWENRLENGIWTYSLEDVHKGLQSCYADLKRDVKEKYGVTLKTVGGMGISAMMHGYMPFDKEGKLLVPFRTWRNTITEQAAAELTQLFGFNIPQRWSIAHLYQAILNNEPHVKDIACITTLAVYVHQLLTGVNVAGVGEASGMFPTEGIAYNAEMLKKFDDKISDKGFDWKIRNILPKVAAAGKRCGELTESGALFLDPEGDLTAGIPLCPPEGDAGTGMVATDSVRAGTGNISAGTSVFSMLVLEKPLQGVYPEIDIVATPDGAPVAMVHCNNCCSELDAWVKVFGEFARLIGKPVDMSDLYETLYRNAMEGDKDCGGVTAYNCLSGEPVIGLDSGKPMYFRAPDGNFTLGNFFRAQLMSALAALKIGNDILFDREKVNADCFAAHGGLFKVKGAAQQILADGLNTPVTVMTTAGEGGAWGMALLAAYMKKGGGKTLPDFLSEDVFVGMEKLKAEPDPSGTAGFDSFMARYKAGLAAEKLLSEIKE